MMSFNCGKHMKAECVFFNHRTQSENDFAEMRRETLRTVMNVEVTALPARTVITSLKVFSEKQG